MWSQTVGGPLDETCVSGKIASTVRDRRNDTALTRHLSRTSLCVCSKNGTHFEKLLWQLIAESSMDSWRLFETLKKTWSGFWCFYLVIHLWDANEHWGKTENPFILLFLKSHFTSRLWLWNRSFDLRARQNDLNMKSLPSILMTALIKIQYKKAIKVWWKFWFIYILYFKKSDV